MTERKPRPRFFRYSLRCLFALVALACLAMGAFAWWLQDLKLQKRIAAELMNNEELGCRLTWDEEFDLQTHRFVKKPTGSPQWLIDLAGGDPATQLNEVAACIDGETQAECDENLQFLLDRLVQLPHLRDLSVYGLRNPIRKIRSFRAIPGIRNLLILDLDLSEEAILEIVQMPDLRRLVIGDTQIDHEDFKHFAAMNQLTHLRIDFGWPSWITAEDLATIAKITSLEELLLLGCEVDAQGLESLLALPNLRSLHLTSTEMTDAAVPVLARMQSLEVLWLGRGISESGYQELVRALLNCTVRK